MLKQYGESNVERRKKHNKNSNKNCDLTEKEKVVKSQISAASSSFSFIFCSSFESFHRRREAWGNIFFPFFPAAKLRNFCFYSPIFFCASTTFSDDRNRLIWLRMVFSLLPLCRHCVSCYNILTTQSFGSRLLPYFRTFDQKKSNIFTTKEKLFFPQPCPLFSTILVVPCCMTFYCI